jgi:outer membrane protein assembly factor BamB
MVLAAACGTTRAVQQDAQSPPFFPAEVVWSVPLSGTLSAPPAFTPIRGYVPLDNARLDAYDLAASKQVWTLDVATTTRPAVGDGLVFVAGPEALVGLRETDGSIAWRQPLTERLSVAAVWDHGWLITVSESGMVGARRAADGMLVWEQGLDSPASAPPALAADRVYVATVDERVVALQVKTGVPVWSTSLGGIPHAIVARDDRVYVGAADNFLYCLRAGQGQVDWRWRTGGDLVGLPHVDDRRVYFTSLDNILRGLDRRSGGQRWLRPLPLRPNTGPVRAADAIIVSGLSPTLRAYAVADGAPRGEMEAPGDLAAPPHLVERDGLVTLIVLTRDVASGTVMTALRPRVDVP